MRTCFVLAALVAACGNSDDNTGIDMEVDPIFTDSTAAGITAAQVGQWIEAHGWGNHATAGYLTAETDPTIGARTASKYCTTDGTAITCEADALAAESDPTITALQAGKFCTSDGVVVTCTADVAETDPEVGTLTNGAWCATNGAAVVCDRPAPALANQLCATRVIGVAADGTLLCAPSVHFLGRRNTVYTWPDTGSDRIVPFDMEVEDTAGAFNPATGVFVAPVSGTYVFSAGLHGQGMQAGSLVYGYIAAGGRNYMGSGHYSASATWDQIHMSATTYLTAGQSASLHGYINANPPGQFYGNAAAAYMWTYFEGSLVD